MKKLTNRQHLPETYVRAAEAFRFSSSRDEKSISVTALIGPPKINVLKKRHGDEIQEDAADRIWAVYGSAVHLALEQADPWMAPVNEALDNAKRLFKRGEEAKAREEWLRAFHRFVEAEDHRDTRIEKFVQIERNGWTIRGVCDLFDADRVVNDWKLKKVYGYIFGMERGFDEIEAQLNLYAHGIREEGEEVRGVRAVMIFRDWNPREEDGEYPREIEPISMRLWSPEECEEYIAKRLALHEAAFNDLPECSGEERWARPDTWAVISAKSKAKKPRALRVLDSLEEAYAWAVEKYGSEEKAEKMAKIVHRPGVSIRCKGKWVRDVGWVPFCPVFEFCEQGQAIIRSQ